MGGNHEKLAAVVAHLRTLAMRERSTGATAAATAPGTGPSRGTGAQEGAAPTLLLPPPSLPFPVAPLVPPARPSGAAPAPAELARPDEGSDAADTLPPLEGHTPRSLAQDTPDLSGQCLSGGLGKATPPHCSAEADATAFRSIGSPRSADLCSVAVTTLSGDFGAGVVSPTAPREMTLLGGLPERVGAPPCQAAPGPPPRGQPQQPQQQPQQQQQQQNLRPAVNRMQTPQQRVTQPLTPPPTPQQPMPPPLMGQGMNPMMMGTPMGAPMNPAMMMGMNPMMLAMGQGNAMFPQMNPMMMGMQQGAGLDPAMNPLMMGMNTGGMPQPMMPMNMMAAPAPGRGVSLAAAPLGRPAPLQTAKRPAACLSSVQFPDSYLPAESRRCVRCAQSSCEAYLMYVDENYSLQQFHMTGGAKEITIGRHSSCTLCLCRRDQTMSRMHAAVKCVRNSDVGHTTSFVIRDTSTGGTAVNTDKVSKPRELRDGDHVFLGQCPVSLFFFRPNTCDNPAFEGILGIPGTGLTKKWIPRHCCITQDVLLLFKKKNVGHTRTPSPQTQCHASSRRLFHTGPLPSRTCRTLRSKGQGARLLPRLCGTRLTEPDTHVPVRLATNRRALGEGSEGCHQCLTHQPAQDTVLRD